MVCISCCCSFHYDHLIGSIFELSGGDPQLGYPATLAIAAVSIPTSIFFFIAAISKGNAETEADDEEFLKGKNL